MVLSKHIQKTRGDSKTYCSLAWYIFLQLFTKVTFIILQLSDWTSLAQETFSKLQVLTHAEGTPCFLLFDTHHIYDGLFIKLLPTSQPSSIFRAVWTHSLRKYSTNLLYRKNCYAPQSCLWVNELIVRWINYSSTSWGPQCLTAGLKEQEAILWPGTQFNESRITLRTQE